MKAIKNSLLKVMSVCVILIFFASLNLNAEDQKKDEGPKFPGKFGIESKIMAEGGIKNSQSTEVTDTDRNKGGNGGSNYFRFEVKPSVTFAPLDFYNIGFFLKDRMDLRMGEPNAIKSGTVDTTVASKTQSVSGTLDNNAIDLKARNRFYAGLDNIFIILKIMTIDAGFELRVSNDLNNTAWLNPKTNKGNVGTEIRLTPYIVMNGSYDFGFSWKINAMFEFYLYPALYQFADYSIDNQKQAYGFTSNAKPGQYWGSDKNKMFQMFQIEIDKLTLSYEFFHFFAPKEIKCSLTYEMYMLATVYNPDYQNQYNDWNYTKVADARVGNATVSVKSNMLNVMKQYIGLNFNFWGLQPYAGFYCIIDQNNGIMYNQNYIDAADRAGVYNKDGLYTYFRPGFKTGLTYKKDWLEVGIGYTGVILTASTDPLFTSSKIQKYAANTIAAYNFESYITSYLTIKL